MTPTWCIKGGSFETSFNLDGIWGGNMYAGGAGAIMPNKITSKHNFRYVPRMNGLDIVKKLRAQIDANGYKDVEVKLIGDVPWSRGSSPDTDISKARRKGASIWSPRVLRTRRRGRAPVVGPEFKWDELRFRGEPTRRLLAVLSVGRRRSRPEGRHHLHPDGRGGDGGGGGGRAHAANEYYTIEAIGKSGRHGHGREGRRRGHL